MSHKERVIIEGHTQDGKTFRPSDWSERLGDLLAEFGRDQRIRYSPLLQPIIRDGMRCVAMDMELKSKHPDIFQHVMEFAEANRLVICHDGYDPIAHADAA
jgi:hypothetical protein